MFMHRILVLGVSAAALAFVAGCSIGPASMRSDRAQYNMAAQKSANEQILLNIVRLKYREPTLFLEIGSISSNFNYSLSGDIGNIRPFYASSNLSGSAVARYAESPTITYTPLQGEQFAKRLMAELDIKTFILLQRAGWSLNRLMRVSVERVGDLRNDPSALPAADPKEPPYEKFIRLVDFLTKLQAKGVLRFRLEPGKGVKVGESAPADLRPAEIIAANKDGYDLLQGKDGKVEVVKTGPPSLVIEADLAPEDRPAFDECLKSLGALRKVTGPQTLIFRLGKPGGPLEDAAEVPLQLRSFLDALYYLAQGIEVPRSHVESGYVKARWHDDRAGHPVEWNIWREATKDLLNVQAGRLPPRQAIVLTQYRGYWFYVDDADIRSKDTFALLSLIFALQAGEVPVTLPILTIPVSGQ